MTEAAGKTVIDGPDRPGFIVNRCARPYYGEALAMLEEGRSASDINAAAMLAAGYRLGPFQLIDLIGADINLAATESLHAAMGNHPRYHAFAALHQAGRTWPNLVARPERFLFPERPGPAPMTPRPSRSASRPPSMNEAAMAPVRRSHHARAASTRR